MADSITVDDHDIPLLSETKELIDEQAPMAVAYLKRTNNLDLAEILGLGEHVGE